MVFIRQLHPWQVSVDVGYSKDTTIAVVCVFSWSRPVLDHALFRMTGLNLDLDI